MAMMSGRARHDAPFLIAFMMRACSITARTCDRGGRCVVLVAAWLVAPYVRSAAFLLDLTGTGGWARRLLPVRVRAVTARDLQVPTRYGDEAARVYEPARRQHAQSHRVSRRPRAAASTSRAWSRSRGGWRPRAPRVLSVPLPDLREFRITPRSTDMIEDATLWLAANRALAPERARRAGRRVASRAASRWSPPAGHRSRAKCRSVVSLGGHADLPRVMTLSLHGPAAGRHDARRRTTTASCSCCSARSSTWCRPSRSSRCARAIVTFLDASSYDQTDVPRNRSELFDLARARTAATAASRRARSCSG